MSYWHERRGGDRELLDRDLDPEYHDLMSQQSKQQHLLEHGGMSHLFVCVLNGTVGALCRVSMCQYSNYQVGCEYQIFLTLHERIFWIICTYFTCSEKRENTDEAMLEIFYMCLSKANRVFQLSIFY